MVQERPVIIERICAVQISSKFTILYRGPKIWNSLHVSVTRSSNLSFKTKMPDFLFK